MDQTPSNEDDKINPPIKKEKEAESIISGQSSFSVHSLASMNSDQLGINVFDLVN